MNVLKFWWNYSDGFSLCDSFDPGKSAKPIFNQPTLQIDSIHGDELLDDWRQFKSMEHIFSKKTVVVMLTYLASRQNHWLYSIDHCCSPRTVKLKRTEFSMQVSSLKSQVGSSGKSG